MKLRRIRNKASQGSIVDGLRLGYWNVTVFKPDHEIHHHNLQNYDVLCTCVQISRYQKGKTNLDFTEARDSEWQ